MTKFNVPNLQNLHDYSEKVNIFISDGKCEISVVPFPMCRHFVE